MLLISGTLLDNLGTLLQNLAYLITLGTLQRNLGKRASSEPEHFWHYPLNGEILEAAGLIPSADSCHESGGLSHSVWRMAPKNRLNYIAKAKRANTRFDFPRVSSSV